MTSFRTASTGLILSMAKSSATEYSSTWIELGMRMTSPVSGLRMMTVG